MNRHFQSSWLAKSLLAATLLMPLHSIFAQNLTPQQDAKKGKWGYVGANGKWAVKPKYEQAEPFQQLPNGTRASEVKLKGLTGYVDENGKVLGPGVIFESVQPISDKAAIVKVKGKYGIVDFNMTYLHKPEMTDVQPVDDSLFIVTLKGKKGLMDTQGRIVLEPKEYTDVKPFGDFWKVYDKEKTGLYDLSKHIEIIKPKYRDVSKPVNVKGMTYIPVQKNNEKWGITNTQGKEVVKCRNTAVTPLPDLGLFFINRPGFGFRLWFPDLKVYLELQTTADSQEGPFRHFKAKIDTPKDSWPDRYSYAIRLDETGDFTTTTLASRQQAYGRFKNGTFYAVIDNNGNLISTTDVDIIKKDGYYFIAQGNDANIYSTDGKLVMSDASPRYATSGSWLLFHDKSSALSPDLQTYTIKDNSNTTFLLDRDNKWHILSDGTKQSAAYDLIEPADDIFHARRDGKWGIIKDGKESIPCTHSNKLNFDTDLGLFLIEENGMFGLMDTAGKMVVPTDYTSFKLFSSSGHILACQNDKYGVYSHDSGFIIPCNYDGISINDAGQMWIRKDHLWGVYDFSGRQIIPIAHDDQHLSLIEGNYYQTTTGGKTQYFSSDGSEIPYKREIKVTSQRMVHNNYDKYNAKGFKLYYDFDSRFLKDESIYIEILVYNENGTPAKKKNGEQIKWGGWQTPSYLFSTYSDLWFTIPYSNFVQPTGTKRYYFAKLRFKDQNGKLLPTTGNDKIEFYMTR